MDISGSALKALPINIKPFHSMPFTLSHVAAVLPLRKFNLVWSALVVGSMAPDFPYIVGTTDYRSLGHQFPGVIEFTIPASLFALWLFHTAIKRPAATLLQSNEKQKSMGKAISRMRNSPAAPKVDP
jgi:hypothetical protein